MNCDEDMNRYPDDGGSCEMEILAEAVAERVYRRMKDEASAEAETSCAACGICTADRVSAERHREHHEFLDRWKRGSDLDI